MLRFFLTINILSFTCRYLLVEANQTGQKQKTQCRFFFNELRLCVGISPYSSMTNDSFQHPPQNRNLQPFPRISNFTLNELNLIIRLRNLNVERTQSTDLNNLTYQFTSIGCCVCPFTVFPSASWQLWRSVILATAKT